jgi:fumarate hydratase class I
MKLPMEAAFKAVRFTKIGGPAPLFEGGILRVNPELLRDLAERAFRELAFYFRRSHLEALLKLRDSPEASGNDREVVTTLLRNAVIAAGGDLASCQDTGTAIVYGWKDEGVHTGAEDEDALEEGTAAAYRKNHLRASQTGARSFFDEFNTGNNLPAQIHLAALPRTPEEGPLYRFLFTAKGGGSSNKTSFFPLSPAILEEAKFRAFLEEKIPALGTAACPPYHLAVAVGGASPEQNLEILKLATTDFLDGLPFFGGDADGNGGGEGNLMYRDRFWEEEAMAIGGRCGLGAQFGGTGLLLSARVIRLPRHAASCPVSVGVSCAAHRSLLAYISRKGLFIEELVHDPGALLRGAEGGDKDAPPLPGGKGRPERRIRLDRPMAEIRAELSGLSPGDRCLLSGPLLVARDRAHLKWHGFIAEGGALPDYLLRHPIYYAGPAAAPPGRITGSIGPTTAQRMDPYGEELMSRGASLITVAKGNRGGLWTEACKKYGGFYLGAVGGAAALQAAENVTGCEIIDYPELGMEAVRLITVEDLPAYIIVDDKGGNLFEEPRPLQSPIIR